MQTYKILIVEDKVETIDMLRVNLKDEPFQIVIATDGVQGEAKFHTEKPDLILLDIGLPKLSGHELCKQIRRHSNVPIIVLTARFQDEDKVELLKLGADDYITKPFSPSELLARINAILRRTYQYQKVTSNQKIIGGPRLKINESNYRVTFDDQTIDLSPQEFNLLHILVTNPGWTFTRSHLMEKVWGYDSESGEETVTVHISTIRQKLGDEGSKLIRTVRGVGYVYEEIT